MNKRIQQLATEAELELTIETKKFAELIVKKCMDIAYDHTPNSEECEYKRLIHNKIKKYFGVEE